MSATLEITLDGLVRRYLISDEFFWISEIEFRTPHWRLG